MIASRARRLILAAAVALVTAALLVALTDQEQAAGAEPAPNIILISTDDQTAESLRFMKRVNSLMVDRGASFTNHISTFPLCCPARATWITGQYAHNNGVIDNQERNGGGYEALRDPTKVLPVWLRVAGYDTALMGKWLHDYRSLRPPPGWDVWNGLIPPTVTRYFGYEIADSRGGKVTAGNAETDYLTDALTRRYAVPYIYSKAEDPDPFFLHVSYTGPHWGKGRNDNSGRRCANTKPFSFETAKAKPAPRHANKFIDLELPDNPAFNERNLSDKPGGVRGRKKLDANAVADLRKRFQCAAAAGLAVDEGVKQIDAALNATGLGEETYVIFASDNGYMNGEHRIRAEKVQPYEEAIKVPLVIRGPGIPAGVEIADPTANVDLVPTIMDLANATQPPLLGRGIDGASLLPYAAGFAHPNRAILIEAKRPPRATARGSVVAPSWVGVRTQRYTYVEYYRADALNLNEGFGLPIGVGELTDRELYDLAVDPHELRSRHSGSAYEAPRATLAATLARLRDCAAEECLFEPAVPPPASVP